MNRRKIAIFTAIFAPAIAGQTVTQAGRGTGIGLGILGVGLLANAASRADYYYDDPYYGSYYYAPVVYRGKTAHQIEEEYENRKLKRELKREKERLKKERKRLERLGKNT